jgi:hypothetical protein
MMNLAQLRAQLERSFSPLACECLVDGDHSLTVKLYHPGSGQVEALVEELRYELESNSLRSSLDSGLA